MYKLIASPFLGNYLVLKPGVQNGVKVSAANYRALRDASASGGECPRWLVDVADGQALSVASIRPTSVGNLLLRGGRSGKDLHRGQPGVTLR